MPTPFDIENVFWSHRGELCTFDVMVEEFGLVDAAAGAAGDDGAGADTARPRPVAGSARPARRLARPLAHVRRRHRTAGGRHAALRRVLSLVPRRDRRNPQLAVRQGEVHDRPRLRHEAACLRSGPHQGHVGATDRQPLREQLRRRGQAAQPDRGAACRARLRDRAGLLDQRAEARAVDRHELHDPA